MTTDIDKLIAEVQRLRADYDRQAAEIAAVYVALGADSKTIVRYKASVLVQRLRADLEEQHLTLAAEQGRQDGAPSDRWRHLGLGTWINEHTGASVRRGGWPVTGPGESIWTMPNGTTGTASSARAAMQAADAAQEPP